ncbi:MAG: EscU/YscU/HrcU family type III secretion system export apparatus switch protein [Betaproteobacteria bacterium]
MNYDEAPPVGPQRRREAVALAYHDGDRAPRVVAQGRGDIADEIIRRAREAGVFTYESRELLGLLMQVDLDAHIPPALYVAIAELLTWVWRVEHASTPS